MLHRCLESLGHNFIEGRGDVYRILEVGLDLGEDTPSGTELGRVGAQVSGLHIRGVQN